MPRRTDHARRVSFIGEHAELVGRIGGTLGDALVGVVEGEFVGADHDAQGLPGDPAARLAQDLGDVPEFELAAIKHFFERYKDLEPGKFVKGSEWVGRAEAEAEIQASFKRLEEQGH